MKAVVLFDTLFGNTEKIANALTKGLREKGIDADCINIGAVKLEDLPRYDFLAVGAPTRAFTAAKPIKDFLIRLEAANLSGKLGYAFDTRIDSRLSGSAAKHIEKKLVAMGVTMVRTPSSAFIQGSGPSDKVGGTTLIPGMEERFEALGREIGDALKSGAPAGKTG
ncbi:MAG: flavodoxin domain-containing protein [Conexivisphaerales archaeon]|jgi:flavorubredoxin